MGAQSAAELIGRSVKDFVHPDNRELSKERLFQLKEKKQPVSLAEEKFRRLDGSIIYVEAAAMPVSFKGKPAIMVIAHDITRRKHLELSLKENEEQFRAITESAPEGVVIVDNDGNILSWSNGAQKIFGYTAEEIIGRPGADLLPAGHYRQSHEHGMEDLHETGNYGKMGTVFESVGLRKDGTSFPIEVSLSPYETSRKIYYYAVIIRDVTERKQTEQRLIETNAFLDNIIESSLDSIVVTDCAGCITRVNSCFAEMLGYPKDDCIGKQIAGFFAREPASYRSKTGDTVKITEQSILNERMVMERLFSEGKVSNFETCIMCRDGTVLPISQNVVLLYDSAREIIGAVGILRDISTHKELVKELSERDHTVRTLINVAPETLFLMDTEGRVIMGNEMMARRFNTNADNLPGICVYDNFTPEVQDLRKKYALEAKTKRERIHFEDCRNNRYFDNFVHPITNEDGVVDRLAVYSLDITERKQAEEELRRHRDHLDELVKEKTAELIIANKKLQKEIDLHVQVEKALGDSEQNFRSLVELSPDGIGIEHDGKVVFINSAGLNILGAEYPEQIIGKQVIDLVHPDYKEMVRKRVSQLYAGGNVSPFIELQFVRLDGSTVDIELGSTSCFYQDKLAAEAVFRDISRRKIIEKALVESEDKFRMLAETTASAIVIFQRAGIVYANPAAESLCCYTLEELKSLNFWEVIPPDYRERFKDSGMKRLRGEEVPAHFEMPILTKNNETRWIDYTAAVINYQGTRSVLGTGVDITSRKLAEEALRKSEEQYRLLVEHANSIILRMDINGVVLFFNEFAQKFFGYAAEEILGRSVVGTIVPKTDTLGRDLDVMINDITRHPEHYAANENENMLRSGERVWIAWTNKAIVDKEGNVTEILCIGTDITRIKLAEQRLLNYQKQLQSLASELSLAEERERRRIAVDLHDRIAQSLALARIKTEELSQSDNCASMKQTSAEIRDLLDQTIQATRSLTFELCPPVLYELGFETALEWQMEEIRKLYGLAITFENNLQSAPLDDDMRVILFQATRELLVNVAKHAGAKSARVCLEKNDSHIRINVEDDGAGFDMADAEQRVGKNGGFGLFSIRERLKYLGGRLECDSQQGCGTRISLVAPMKKS